MPSPYELSYLSDYSYGSSGTQQTRTFSIGGSDRDSYINRQQGMRGVATPATQAGDWAIVHDNGISDAFYASKYQNLHTGEFVIAFRGTGFAASSKVSDGIMNSIKYYLSSAVRGASDVGVDLMHLALRSSPYVALAANYIAKNRENNLVLTGHSLGGFLAFSMAYFYKVRVVAFNPPYVLVKPGEQVIQGISGTFKQSRIIVYESTDDFVTMMTRMFKTRPDNIQYRSLGKTGGHSITGMSNKLKKIGREDIVWNF